MKNYLIEFTTVNDKIHIEEVSAYNEYDAIAKLSYNRGFYKFTPISIVSIVTETDIIYQRVKPITNKQL